MPLVGGADLNGTASDDPTDLWFDRPYRASPTGLKIASRVQFEVGNVIKDLQMPLVWLVRP
eukprot:6185244-Pleurochrysis_carterae.AAC.1